MLLAPLLLAALPVGAIPVWDCIARFPNASYWPGVGQQKTSNMLKEIRRDVGGQMRGAGPGPQQLAARWAAGQLDSNEKVAVLLGGADYHHPALLPVYAEALRSASGREKAAALIGFHWLLGEAAPDATALPADAPLFRQAAWLVEALVAVTRERTLVAMWIDSYLAATGQPRWGEFVLRREAGQCLAAIREIAEPADLESLVALWPLLASQGDRYTVMGIIEMISLQKFVEIAKSPRGGWGEVFYEASARRVDEWVGSRCRRVDGQSLVVGKVRDLAAAWEGDPLAGWLSVLQANYPRVWPTVADALPAFGAPAISLNRQRPDDPANQEAVRRLREHFPVTVERLKGAPAAAGPVR